MTTAPHVMTPTAASPISGRCPAEARAVPALRHARQIAPIDHPAGALRAVVAQILTSFLGALPQTVIAAIGGRQSLTMGTLPRLATDVAEMLGIFGQGHLMTTSVRPVVRASGRGGARTGVSRPHRRKRAQLRPCASRASKPLSKTSGVGGQPGMCRSTGTTADTPPTQA